MPSCSKRTSGLPSLGFCFFFSRLPFICNAIDSFVNDFLSHSKSIKRIPILSTVVCPTMAPLQICGVLGPPAVARVRIPTKNGVSNRQLVLVFTNTAPYLLFLEDMYRILMSFTSTPYLMVFLPLLAKNSSRVKIYLTLIWVPSKEWYMGMVSDMVSYLASSQKFSNDLRAEG